MKDYIETLSSLRSADNFRTIPSDTSDTDVVDLSTNDYLGIGADSALKKEFLEYYGADLPSFTSSASRLLASRQKEYVELEDVLQSLYGRRVLLFNSGYHANVGAVSALVSLGRTLVVADRLVHASIIDGIVLGRSAFERFRHNDVDHLRRILEKKAGDYDRVLVVTESVFSMDGDMAPLEEIAALKHSFRNMLLYVDEAHAFGVIGRSGLGLAVDIPEVDFIIGTLGKAAASMGAFIAVGNVDMRDFLINKTRSFIFSTALPPVNCAWSRFVIDRIVGMDAGRRRLRKMAELLCKATGSTHVSHIQPLVTGSSSSALELSAVLLEEGFKVLPIRTPTVPPGTERLRFSLSLDIKEDDIVRLVNSKILLSCR